MIYQFPDSIQQKNKEEKTAIHIACQYCTDPNVIQLLLIFSADAVNCVDADGNLPLHILLKQKRLLMSSNVIEQMITINLQMVIQPVSICSQKLPLFYAMRYQPDSTVRAMVECYPHCLSMPTDSKGRLPLHLACISVKKSLIPYFIEKYPKAIKQHDNKNKLPIHYASAQIDAIRMDILHQLVETWSESCYKFYN